MIAIVVATGQNGGFYGLDEFIPIPLLPLADRPFLQHVVEALARQGVRRFEFILSHLPERIEETLGDGARWGCSFRYHLHSAGDPLRLARTIAGGSPEQIVLASGTRLPDFTLAGLPPDTFLYSNGAWTGWGFLEPGALLLSSFDPLLLSNSSADGGLPGPVNLCTATRCLSVETGEDFLRSQTEALSGTFPGLMIAGRQADPGIWLSRNVALHPSVQVTAPVYVGENCRIARGAKIGPSAVIGPNCIIDSQSVVVNSMVAAGTYIGEALELDSVIVDRNRLVNVRLGTSFLASETFLLGSLMERASGRALERLRDRVAAVLLLLVLWPILLLTLLVLLVTRKGRLTQREVVEIPAPDSPATWQIKTIVRFEPVNPDRRNRLSRLQQILYEFIPGLFSVLEGNVFFVGARPRSRADVEALPPDWKSLYLKTKAGLITEADVMFGRDASEDELYTSEVFYSATESFRHDVKLLARWLWQTVAGTAEQAPDLMDHFRNS